MARTTVVDCAVVEFSSKTMMAHRNTRMQSGSGAKWRPAALSFWFEYFESQFYMHVVQLYMYSSFFPPPRNILKTRSEYFA